MSTENRQHSVDRPLDAEQRESANQALTTTNLIMGMLCAIFALAFVYFQFFYRPDVDPSQVQAYAKVAEDRLAKHADVIQEEFVSITSETVPTIADEVYDQARQDYPKYITALEQEGSVYLSNVEEMIRDKVRAQFREYLKKHRQILKEEFPEHASEENVDRVMKEFELVFDRLVDRYYLDEFRQETQRTKDLWTKFEPLPPPGPNEPSHEEQLADYVADWTVIALAEEGTEAVQESDPMPSPTPEPTTNQ